LALKNERRQASLLDPKSAKIGSRRHIRLRPTECVFLYLGRPFVGHTDKIDYTANAQSLHHSAAVNLDGLLGDAQIASNLLVEAPRDDRHEYFALTGGQGRNFYLDRFQLRMKLTGLSIPGLST
jgi:hypothetical protein